MPQPGARPESGGTNPLRCYRCGVAVGGTGHTRSGYTVGHYALHAGPTEEATIRQGLDEPPITYRRLIHPVLTVSCPACFADPATRRLWDSVGDDTSTEP